MEGECIFKQKLLKLPENESCIFLRVSGGVCNNDFIMELISSLAGCTIHRLVDPDSSLLGAAYLAGIGAGKFVS